MSEIVAESVHPIFTKDPKEWMGLIHKFVQVTTEDNQSHKGYVYTVDPVSESIVLLKPSQANKIDFVNLSLKLLPGASIIDVTILEGDVDPQIMREFDRLFRPASSKSLSHAEINNRRLRLKQWLEKHRLPVCVSPDGQALIVAEALTILPPYCEDSCLSTNEIILSRIRTLIRDMPSDESLEL
ncbi:gem-associated protein 6-like [Plakobranchus ocellatus]|uniref:Gem-associated protein 6-like n=1 Tax=Plakobranchus ocellatus TaxID=259542 RepID=A0AAV4CBD5_9GAST|nr:gem-associated protein 6-like [Plakobranchus ocellatus]